MSSSFKEQAWGIGTKRASTSLCYVISLRTSLVAQMVKRLPTMRETKVQSLGWEDPLEKEMATHSSTLAWKIPWTEERGRLQPMGSQESDTTERLHFTSLLLWETSVFLIHQTAEKAYHMPLSTLCLREENKKHLSVGFCPPWVKGCFIGCFGRP